jgi:hypothetical protein
MNLATDRLQFSEASSAEFYKVTVTVEPTAVDASDRDMVDSLVTPLTRQTKRQELHQPDCTADEVDTTARFFHQVFSCARKLDANQLATLSLNLGLLDRVPLYLQGFLIYADELLHAHYGANQVADDVRDNVYGYFRDITDAQRLPHPLELVGSFTHPSLESLALELQTLRLDDFRALSLQAEGHNGPATRVDDTDISGFIKQGRRVLLAEVDRTVTYVHELGRICAALSNLYYVPEIPLSSDAKSTTLIKKVYFNLNRAMEKLKQAMDVFEQRLNEASECSMALKMGVYHAADQKKHQHKMRTVKVPNFMRPAQTLQAAGPSQVSMLSQFFSEYIEQLQAGFQKHALLHGELKRLLPVVHDPSRRDALWGKPELSEACWFSSMVSAILIDESPNGSICGNAAVSGERPPTPPTCPSVVQAAAGETMTAQQGTAVGLGVGR